MGFLKNNPRQSSRAYPILSDVSGFPGSKIGDTFDSCNIGHGPLKRCGSSGVHLSGSGPPLALDKAGRMFGCLPLDGPRREGGLFAGLRTYLPLRRLLLLLRLIRSAPLFRNLNVAFVGSAMNAFADTLSLDDQPAFIAARTIPRHHPRLRRRRLHHLVPSSQYLL